MQSAEHWNHVYTTKGPQAVSWYQPQAGLSLALIRGTQLAADASILDVGGGASTLVDDLLQEGYARLTVLDLSSTALQAAQSRLGERAGKVCWKVGDITQTPLPAEAYDLWHDRAVFHFLSTAPERAAYVAAATQAVRPGGYLVIATFALDGPERCSGLPVMRYSAEQLQQQFSAAFDLLHWSHDEHRTPADNMQKFIYCVFAKRAV